MLIAELYDAVHLCVSSFIQFFLYVTHLYTLFSNAIQDISLACTLTHEIVKSPEIILHILCAINFALHDWC